MPSLPPSISSDRSASVLARVSTHPVPPPPGTALLDAIEGGDSDGDLVEAGYDEGLEAEGTDEVVSRREQVRRGDCSFRWD
jgi:hypothetical protein